MSQKGVIDLVRGGGIRKGGEARGGAPKREFSGGPKGGGSCLFQDLRPEGGFCSPDGFEVSFPGEGGCFLGRLGVIPSMVPEGGVVGGPEGREKGGPPGLGSGRGARRGGMKAEHGGDFAEGVIEPTVERDVRWEGRRRGDDDFFECALERCPISSIPVRGWWRQYQGGGVEVNNNGDVVGTCGRKGCPPVVDKGACGIGCKGEV
jgi:hypothetical protein